MSLVAHTKPKMGKALAVSLATHCALVVAVIVGQSNLLNDDNRIAQTALEVRSVSEADFQKKLRSALSDNEKQIVQTDDQLVSDRAPQTKDQKVFLSKHNQVVDHNTRAAKVGTFKNVLHEGTSGVDATPAAKFFNLTPSSKDLEQLQAASTKTGRLIVPEQRSPAKVTGAGQSATNDYLEDVAVGANTLLNTQEFKFYAFYERIREKLSSEWERRLGIVFESLYNRQEGLNFDRRTKVQITLNQAGEVQDVKVVASSGLRELDEAATGAFKGAAPFPNPPKDMIDSNNRVVVRWDFIIVADAAGAMRVEVKRMPAGF